MADAEYGEEAGTSAGLQVSSSMATQSLVELPTKAPQISFELGR